MDQTLPLFDWLDPGAEAAERDPGGHVAGTGAAGVGRVLAERRLEHGGVNPALSRSERHLRAARRLSRSIRRYPEGSAAQTRAGLAICHHLQALLAESQS